MKNCSKLQLAATNKISAVGGRNEVYSEGVSKKRAEGVRQYQHICDADRMQPAK
jgi:hypothetical protein